MESSQSADLTVTSSSCEASVGEELHQKRDNVLVH